MPCRNSPMGPVVSIGDVERSNGSGSSESFDNSGDHPILSRENGELADETIVVAAGLQLSRSPRGDRVHVSAKCRTVPAAQLGLSSRPGAHSPGAGDRKGGDRSGCWSVQRPSSGRSSSPLCLRATNGSEGGYSGLTQSVIGRSVYGRSGGGGKDQYRWQGRRDPARSSPSADHSPLSVKINQFLHRSRNNCQRRRTTCLSSISSNSQAAFSGVYRDRSVDALVNGRRSFSGTSTGREVCGATLGNGIYKTSNDMYQRLGEPLTRNGASPLGQDVPSNSISVHDRLPVDRRSTPNSDHSSSNGVVRYNREPFRGSRSPAKDFSSINHLRPDWNSLAVGVPNGANGEGSCNGGGRRTPNGNASTICRQPSRCKSVDTSFDISEIASDQLGEMMGELQEERHTAAVATQRLQAEQVEKQQLQRQLSEAQSEFERMCMLNEQLEAELVTQSVTDGGQSTTDGQFDLEQDSGAATYRRKWEFTVRELEFAKKRMQQQHEDDEEQLMAVRKQLERKLESAVEQADEQRQLVAQLKRKVARLSSEAGDQKVHLDEQVSRNNVLERRQRKFDSDMQTLEDKLKREKQNRERISQEKDQLQSEVYSVNNEMAALRLEMSMCEEKAAQLRRELEVVQSADQLSDDEAAQLRRSRLELQRLCDEREQQLEDAAGQTSLLEQAKLRLEMCLQQARQMHRSELAQKDEELEELRASLGKKVKALECQLEVEHDERSTLVRDKHELERRVIALGECSLTSDTRQQEAVQRLRRQLKRTRALLADSQLQLERGCGEGNGGKAQLRQLRNQLEDAEFAAAAAARGRHAVETELQEVQLAAEEAQRSRAEAEARATAASRQLTQLQNQLDEQDDELQEVMKKYKSCVAQLSCDQLTMTEQSSQLDQLNSEVTQLRQQLSEVTARCQQLAGDSGSRDDQRRLELRLRELESRLEFESAGRQRIERQAIRLREEVQQSGQEASQCRERELSCSDQLKKLQRQLRDVREELAESKRHETDASQQLRTLTKQLEHSEAEAVQNRSDLRLALKRIADLQNAIQGDVESEELSDSEDSLSDGDSAHDDDDLDSFLSARLPSSLLLSVPTPAATSLENGSSALSPDSACSNNNNSSERSNGNSKHTDPPDPQ